jgi:carbon-monoxide dehydrogenase medium subunit
MEYIRPDDVREALSVMSRWNGKARLIAGGTNVIPDLRAKTVEANVLVDISHMKNLSYVQEEQDKIRIGGLTTISELASSRVIQEYAPILSEAADQLGNPLVRNRATIGGNLADASPAADTAVPLLVLEAMVTAVRDGGACRKRNIDRFFLGPNKTVLEPEEMITEIAFPKPDPSSKMAYIKLGLRNAMAISVVSVAAVREMDRTRCRKARIALGAVAPKPLRAYDTEKLFIGEEITQDLIEACYESVQKEIAPITDIRATAEYRRSMASVLLRRVMK